jgi:SpoVK/Ycf46/Vps4 family AAA+-type ATPase
LKAKKMKLEIRKLSNDVWRKDIEAEEKWLENCGEDEEFLKRESKRLHRDLLRIAPVYIGGSDSESGKLFQGWDSVAGLQDVIRCMKEVVILPLLYPEFFNNLGLTPPRGVLLHGYPGTGKTLVVRALIGACARGDKRIAYFARKGADCLGNM